MGKTLKYIIIIAGSILVLRNEIKTDQLVFSRQSKAM